MFAGGSQDNGTNQALSTTTPNSWDQIYGGDGGSVAIDPTNSQTLYVEIQGFPTIQKSTDGGATFTSAVNGITDQGGVFNPQQQFRVRWPAEPAVARAYLDQLERGEGLSQSLAADLAKAVDRSAARLEDGARDKELATGLESLAAALEEEDRGDTIAQGRRAALGETLSGIAARLR